MDLAIPPFLSQRLDMVRWLGREYLRPIGLECDRLGRPAPADHPFYFKWAELGLQARAIGRDDDADRPRRDGPGWGARGALLVAEEASYWDRGMAVTLPGPGLGGPPVAGMGTTEQRERYLAPFRDRAQPHWAAFAMTEPGAGSDVARIATRCERRGDGWRLVGEKAFCSNADRADWIVVWATIDRQLGRAGHRAFVVARGAPGLTVAKVEKKMGLTAYASCSLVLADCDVAATELLGGEEYYAGGAGFKGAMKTFDATRPIVAAMAVGIARAAWDHAAAFVRANYDLRRPLPRYRRLVERLAAAQRRIEAGKLLAWKAAWLADLKQPNTLEAAIAKAYTPRAAQEAVSLCMDVMGDAGAVNDQLVEKLYRDVKAMDIVEGTGQIQRRVIARRTLDYPHE